MDENWKTLVPSQYIPITKCHYEIHKLLSRRFNVQIVICTAYGQILEFAGHRLVGSCEVKCSDINSISVIITYGSKCDMFYIVQSESEIRILSRENGLKVKKLYQNVKKFLVTDFLSVGYPQLGIWTKDAKESLKPTMIVNVKEGDTVSEDPSISNILKEKQQELAMKIEEYEHRLKTKKQLRIQNSEIAGIEKKSFVGSSLVLLVGEEDNKEVNPMEGFSDRTALRIGETWQRFHNGKWIIGVTLCNYGKRNAMKIYLMLTCPDEEKLLYTTHLVMCNNNQESPTPHKRMKLNQKILSRGVAWKEVTFIKPGRKAVILGVMDSPKFIKSPVATLFGVVTYEDDGGDTLGHQVPVPSLQLKVEDFSKHVWTPFTTDSTEADLLCVLMSSYTVTLPTIFEPNFEASLEKILLDELKFTEFPSIGCLFHKGTTFTELSGIMIHVVSDTPLKYSLTICTRDVQQLFIFVQCMYSALTPPHMIIHPPEVETLLASESENRRNLNDELDYVLNQLKQYAIAEDTTTSHKSTVLKPDLRIPYEDYYKFRARLSELEMKTDIGLFGKTKHQ